jgi:hypothetical protein
MPAELPGPPVVAQSNDPFTTLRVIDVVARLPRGVALPLPGVVDRLNAANLDWLFDRRVVADVLLQLQSNWMADYRNTSGIILDEEGGVARVTIEDTTRVDPWIVRQAARTLAACHEALRDFSLRDRPTGE